ncbi:MAG: sensor histidine kinase [Gammaproteobacteria bacterium]
MRPASPTPDDPKSITGRFRVARHRNAILAAMLLLIHGAVWGDFGDLQSRSLMLVHLGLFMLWQPLWSQERRLRTAHALAAVLLVVFVIYWFDRWLVLGWLVLFCGLVAGLPVIERPDRLVYMPTLAMLVCDLLIGCVPQVFELPTLPPLMLTLFKYGLLVIPGGIALVPTSRHTAVDTVDLLRAVTMSMTAAILASSSVLGAYHFGIEYPVALFRSLLGLAAFLFLISWLLALREGRVGLGQLWERSLMNVPLERWLAELARLAEREKTPEGFIRSASETLARLLWLNGVGYHVANAGGVVGKTTAHGLELGRGDLSIVLYARRPLRPSLRAHCKLLVELLVHFHTAKVREIELARRAHIEAVYETGARVAHDIKNLLQSLNTLTTALSLDMAPTKLPPIQGRPDRQHRGQEILKTQLPLIIDRLQSALTKLQKPEKTSNPETALEAWWREAEDHHASMGVEFRNLIHDGIHDGIDDGIHDGIRDARRIPGDLFHSVLDNLLENAYYKRRVESELDITVTLASRGRHPALTVCDNGSVIGPETADQLFKQPVPSRSGHGIGLYQAAKRAEMMGYSLALTHNRPGQVCFELTTREDPSGGSDPAPPGSNA